MHILCSRGVQSHITLGELMKGWEELDAKYWEALRCTEVHFPRGGNDDDNDDNHADVDDDDDNDDDAALLHQPADGLAFRSFFNISQMQRDVKRCRNQWSKVENFRKILFCFAVTRMQVHTRYPKILI